ncbi:MAG: hypothetical protein U5L72_11650 [Bacteroidales bacterium]|nr:hypothetical protein [Bacteroidales bacterium]
MPGEALDEPLRDGAGVEEDLPGALLLAEDLARHDVARRELGELVACRP